LKAHKEVDEYREIFRNPVNAGVIKSAFHAIRKAMRLYDEDESHSLDFAQLTAFARDQLPAVYPDRYMYMHACMAIAACIHACRTVY
jgi:hypothetical protein